MACGIVTFPRYSQASSPAAAPTLPLWSLRCQRTPAGCSLKPDVGLRHSSFNSSARLRYRRNRTFFVIGASLGAKVPEASSESARESLKKEVIRMVANTDRGKATTAEQRARILEKIEALEAQSPTSDPVRSPLISGDWSLLYTANVDEDSDKKVVDKYAGTEEGPFLARVKPLAFGTVKQRASSQVINTEAGTVDNIAEFVVLGVPGKLLIRGSLVESPAILGKGYVRVDVTFQYFKLTIGSLPPVTISLSWVQPKGWVDTTYLDTNFRMGRGDKGSVFVSARKA